MLFISMYMYMLFFVLSIINFFFSIYFYMNSMVIFIEWEFMNLSSSSLIMLIMLDWVSLMFMSVVFFISSMVFVYSKNYMDGELNYMKFFYLIFFFVLSMALMILSPNLISIMLGWDGLGLVSYLLVIYYNNLKSFNSGMLTVLSNRMGDISLILCIGWITTYGSFNFFYFTNLSEECKIILFMVVLAGMTKSAQIPFSAWLPAAMAAPTPVSSLVHSSTLVTAGVYLMIRFFCLIEFNYYIFMISFLTVLMSGMSAINEFDLKKIIALSTLSQLGMMLMILSLGFYEISLFHLMSHAMFKSLLFLCAGYFIHNSLMWQDIRNLGALSISSPLIGVFFFFSSLSLCGFPFLSGFYSKDLIIELIYIDGYNFFLFLLILFTLFLTLFYSFRLIFYMNYFKGSLNVKQTYLENKFMFMPMMLLFIVSVVTGSFMMWMFFPMNFIFISLNSKIFVLFILLTLLSLSLMFSKMKMMKFNYKMMMIINMWMMPYLFCVEGGNKLGYGILFKKMFDHGWLEKISGRGSFNKITFSSLVIDKMNFLSLKIYLIFFFFMFIMMM